MNAYDYIEDYLAGKLHGDQLANFEKELQMNVELKHMVDNYGLLRKASEGLMEAELLRGIRAARKGVSWDADGEDAKAGEAPGMATDEGDTRSDEDTVGEAETEDEAELEAKRVSLTGRWMKYAAGLLLLVLAGWLVYQSMAGGVKSSEELFAEYYEEPIWQTTKGGSSNPVKSDADYIEKATSVYLGGDIEEAQRILADSIEYQPIANYWLAQMYLKKGDAKTALQVVPDALPTDVYPDSYYLLRTLLHLKNGDIDEAKRVAERLSGEYRELKENLN